SPNSTRRDTVNRLKLESYLRGVVPAEMPASWHQPALRSQAIAARTYAVRERRSHPSRHYDLCETTACQVYRGVGAEQSTTNRAIKATEGEVLTYNGSQALTQYSPSAGGWTSSGGKPYLPAQKDPWDNWSGNQVHTWHKSVSIKTVERKYPELGSFSHLQVIERNGNGAWGGRVKRLRL